MLRSPGRQDSAMDSALFLDEDPRPGIWHALQIARSSSRSMATNIRPGVIRAGDFRSSNRCLRQYLDPAPEVFWMSTTYIGMLCVRAGCAASTREAMVSAGRFGRALLRWVSMKTPAFACWNGGQLHGTGLPDAPGLMKIQIDSASNLSDEDQVKDGSSQTTFRFAPKYALAIEPGCQAPLKKQLFKH